MQKTIKIMCHSTGRSRRLTFLLELATSELVCRSVEFVYVCVSVSVCVCVLAICSEHHLETQDATPSTPH
jgi:hypothetical protein